MARILALDYGGRRTGIATTDPLQIIATPLITVQTEDLMDYLTDYIAKEDVCDLLVGQPTRHDGSFSGIEKYILEFMRGGSESINSNKALMRCIALKMLCKHS